MGTKYCPLVVTVSVLLPRWPYPLGCGQAGVWLSPSRGRRSAASGEDISHLREAIPPNNNYFFVDPSGIIVGKYAPRRLENDS